MPGHNEAMFTITYREGNGFEDGIGVAVDEERISGNGGEVNALLVDLADRIAKRFKWGSRVVYAGTRCGNMKPGALVMIPGALFAKRAKSTAIKVATEAIREWSRTVEIKIEEKPRTRTHAPME